MLLELAVGDAGYVKASYQGRLGYTNGIRPVIPISIFEELPSLAELIEACRSEDPSERPRFTLVRSSLEEHAPRDSMSLVDTIEQKLRAK